MTNEVYIIDPSVADYQTLIDGLPTGSQWYLLDAYRDGLEQILALLADHADIPALHIISHGNTGSVYLGSTVLNGSNLDAYASTLTGISSHLSASGDILLYGCDIGAGTIGQGFIDRLAALTGADVVASTDLTGAGGDWLLEASSGAVEAMIFSSTDYLGTLATLTGGEGDDTLTGTANADTINGRAGNDTIKGLGGNDVIDGGYGDDKIYGGDGNDQVKDEYGSNTIYGEGGSDEIQSDHFGRIFGGDGDDRILGGKYVEGGLGNDYLSGDGGTADGGPGDDYIYLSMYYSLNTAIGGDGNDRMDIDKSLLAWTGNDIFVDAGDGNDEINVYLAVNAHEGGQFFVDGGSGIDFCKLTFYEQYISNAAIRSESFSNIDIISISRLRGNLRLVGDFASAEFFFTPMGVNEIDATGLSHGLRLTFQWEDGAPAYPPSETPATIIGSDFSDQIKLLASSDLITGGFGDDHIDGGDGVDTAIYSGVRAGYVITEVTYNTFTIRDTVGTDGTDTIVDVNKLQFSDQTIDVVIRGLQIIGDGTAEVISGGTEADFIDGAGGNDTLSGLAGNDTLEGGAGADNLSGASGNDFLNGGDGNDQVTGGLGSDTIESGNGDDTVDAGDGNDIIVGGNGAGNDTYKGGTGNDTVKYTSALASITVDLSAASNQATSTAGGDAAGIGTDQLSGIESIIAGNFNDRLTGNAANNRLDGWLGADAMLGLAGNDTYVVDNASDRVYETTTKAGSTDAGGTDTVQSSISLNLGAYTGISFVEKLVLTGSANINGVGNDLANTITGNDGKNTLTGGLGGDSLNGGAGSDILIGGAGNDTLIGGLGLDRFRFNTALGGSNIDTIKGFVTADDTIQLDDAVFVGIGPLGALAADAFVTGTVALDENDRIIFNSETRALLYDADGSGAGAAVQFATISGLTGTVTASDFVVI